MLIDLKNLRARWRARLDGWARWRRLPVSALALAAGLLFSGATSAHSAPKTVLVLGDSLSAEYGLSHGSGWVPLLEQRLQAQRIEANVVNASVSGETTSGGLARLPALLARHHPSIVVVELGANDGLRGLPLPAAEANLRAIARQARQAGAQVLLLGMRLPPNYGRAYGERFFGLFGKLARELKAPLVPFMLEGMADQAALFQSDRLHPTAQAQPIILDNIWPQLLPMLKTR
jgi:acyl-CoA thioesterase-1